MIIVEGKDDKNFFIALLNDLKKNQDIQVSNTINFDNYIEVMGGKRKLLDSQNTKYKKISMKIENDDIEKALFIFDCDFKIDDKNCNGMKESQKCYDNLMGSLKWDIQTDVHIFDKNLDYFLLETINSKECYQYFDNLITCLDVEKLKPNKKPIANLYRDLYHYPQFDFKDDRFDTLKTKLINLFKEQR
ncbi:MAG: hypothetical protein Q9M39_09955 [Sulfurovum sp.]|nr:hypothetical protein [Sulfurovum sp.]